MSDQNTNPKYRTRYGVMTPDEAAFDLLERSSHRLEFLSAVLEECGYRGEGFMLSGYTACGLATILTDISHDVGQARYYYYGVVRDERWQPEPGKTEDMPEVKP